MDPRSALLYDLRMSARRRGIELEDMFYDADPKKLGFVSVHQFEKIITYFSLWIDQNKFNQAIQGYVENDKLDYKRFLDNSTPVETTRSVSISLDELRAFGLKFKAQGLHVKELFQQFDPYYTGKLDKNNFYRAAGNDAFVNSLYQQYKLPTSNDVDYIRLSQDVEKAMMEKPTQQQMAPDMQLPPFFNRIVDAVRIQSVDINRVFLLVDRFKQQICTTQQFSQVINNLGVHLSPQEFNQLVLLFAKGSSINYPVFCYEIEKALQNYKPVERKPIEMVSIDRLVKNLSIDFENRHSQVIEQFTQLDPQGTGIIPSLRFFRALTLYNFRLTQGEMSALQKEFGEGDESMNYKKFLSAVHPQYNEQASSNIDPIVERLKDYLHQRFIQIRPVLERYDLGQTGKINLSDFLAALRSISFDVTPREQVVLKNKYGLTREGTIDINDLSTRVDPAALTTKPQVVSQEAPFSRQQSITKSHTRPEPSASVIDALARVYDLSEQYNLDFMYEFRKYDPLRRGFVTLTRFRNTMLTLPTPLSHSQLDLLLSTYKDDDNTNFNYSNFNTDLQKYGKTTFQNRSATVKPGLSDLTKSILIKVRAYVDQNRLLLSEIFDQYSPNRSGHLAKARVGPILNNNGIYLTNAEVQNLLQNFSDTRNPEIFNYRRFCDSIEQMQVMETDLATMKVDSHTSTMDREVASLVNAIRERLQARRRKLRDVFAGCSPNGISMRDFRSKLDELGLVFREADIQKLIRNYKCNMQSDVDWQRFCDDVETSKTLQTS